MIADGRWAEAEAMARRVEAAWGLKLNPGFNEGISFMAHLQVGMAASFVAENAPACFNKVGGRSRTPGFNEGMPFMAHLQVGAGCFPCKVIQFLWLASFHLI